MTAMMMTKTHSLSHQSSEPENEPRLALVFVYGSLKRGYWNYDRYLAATTGSEFLGEASTEPIYRLFTNGAFPYLVKDEANGYAVQGEIFAVDEPTLMRLDRLEGVPGHYRRERAVLQRFELEEALYKDLEQIEPFVYVYYGDTRRLHEVKSGNWKGE